MDLFSNETTNLLPMDGSVYYYGPVMPADQANHYLDVLFRKISWKNDEARLFGKNIQTKRKVAWYGDKAFEYAYSNTQKLALPWTSDLLELKNLTEQLSGETYNSCLMNLYHNGTEGVGWHRDGEKDLLKDGAIGSLSFGAERKFVFKHVQTGQVSEIFLENGSLLVMKGVTQTHWTHRLPPATRIKTARINLTFRTIVNG